MKKLFLLLTATAFLFFAACDELADSAKITFQDVEIEEVLDIPLSDFTSKALSLTGDEDTKSFMDSTNISLANAKENTDSAGHALADYLDKIDTVEITSFTLKLLEQFQVDDSTIIIPADFKVKNLSLIITDLNDTIYSETFTDIVPGTMIDTQFTNEIIEKMANILAKNKKIKIKVYGKVSGSKGHYRFGIKSKLMSDIKVKGTDLLGL